MSCAAQISVEWCTMAVPKLDLKRAGLVDDSLQLTRYERTHKWLQSCTDPSDSLAETDTVFSVHSEVAAAPDSAQPGSGAAGRARSRASHAQTLDYRNTTLEQTLGQVLGNSVCSKYDFPSAHAFANSGSST